MKTYVVPVTGKCSLKLRVNYGLMCIHTAVFIPGNIIGKIKKKKKKP